MVGNASILAALERGRSRLVIVSGDSSRKTPFRRDPTVSADSRRAPGSVLPPGERGKADEANVSAVPGWIGPCIHAAARLDPFSSRCACGAFPLRARDGCGTSLEDPGSRALLLATTEPRELVSATVHRHEHSAPLACGLSDRTRDSHGVLETRQESRENRNFAGSQTSSGPHITDLPPIMCDPATSPDPAPEGPDLPKLSRVVHPRVRPRPENGASAPHTRVGNEDDGDSFGVVGGQELATSSTVDGVVEPPEPARQEPVRR